jgi:hypothetical protein
MDINTTLGPIDLFNLNILNKYIWKDDTIRKHSTLKVGLGELNKCEICSTLLAVMKIPFKTIMLYYCDFTRLA